MPDEKPKNEPVKAKASTPEQKLEWQRNQLEMKKLDAERSQEIGTVRRGGGAMAIMPETFSQMETFVVRMSNAGVAVGKALRGNPGACEAVAQMAWGWGMNPYAVSRKVYIVSSNKNPDPVIAFEAQLINAVINARAPLERKTKISYKGEGNKLQCVLTVYPIGEEPFEFEGPEIGRITTKNSSLWKSNPKQQLAYHAQRDMARLHYPEIIMGVYSKEEMEERTDFNNPQRETRNVNDQIKELGKSETAMMINVVEVDENVPEKEVEEAEVIEAEDDEPEAAQEEDEQPVSESPVQSETKEDAPEVETDEEVSEDASGDDTAPKETSSQRSGVDMSSDMDEWVEYLAETTDPDAITQLFIDEVQEPWRTEMNAEQIAWITNTTNARIAELKGKDDE